MTLYLQKKNLPGISGILPFGLASVFFGDFGRLFFYTALYGSIFSFS